MRRSGSLLFTTAAGDPCVFATDCLSASCMNKICA